MPPEAICTRVLAMSGLPSALLAKWATPFDHETAKLKKYCKSLRYNPFLKNHTLDVRGRFFSDPDVLEIDMEWRIPILSRRSHARHPPITYSRLIIAFSLCSSCRNDRIEGHPTGACFDVARDNCGLICCCGRGRR